MTTSSVARATPTAAASLLLCVLAACGGGNTPQANASAADAAASTNQCTLLTEADASALFGEPATAEPTDDLIGNQVSKCVWHWTNPDSTVSEQKGLQLTVWNGAQYYNPPDDAEPLQIGDRGYIQAHGQFKSVHIAWVQNGRTYSLVYDHQYIDISSGATNTTPDSIDKIKKLAETIAGRV